MVLKLKNNKIHWFIGKWPVYRWKRGNKHKFKTHSTVIRMYSAWQQNHIFSKLVLIMLNKCLRPLTVKWRKNNPVEPKIKKNCLEQFHVTFKSSNLGLTRADKKQKVNNSSITMSVAAEVVSTNALTLHFLQAKRGETKHGLLLIILHTAERRQAARPQQISTTCTQRINFHCQQLVISESQ